MPKLPRLSGAQMVRILAKFGFSKVRQKGSHIILKKGSVAGAIGCVVPLHKELAQGTMRGILKQARIDVQDFIRTAK